MPLFPPKTLFWDLLSVSLGFAQGRAAGFDHGWRGMGAFRAGFHPNFGSSAHGSVKATRDFFWDEAIGSGWDESAALIPVMNCLLVGWLKSGLELGWKPQA